MLTPEEIQNYGLWLQSGAVFLSAVGVIITLIWNRNIARRRATLDLIMMWQSNAELIKGRSDFVKLRDGGHLVQWADPAKSGSSESATIRSVLNRYELVAIGIKQRTLDKTIYELWLKTVTVSDWIHCRTFVLELRKQTGIPTLYCEYEALAKSWANEQQRKFL